MLKFLVILVIFHHGVNCAIRKSWKAAPNFNEDVPKFTPFENMELEVKKEEFNEIKTTEAVTQPSPSAETIKISSKFKMPEKMAEIFKEEPKEDFGKFTYEKSENLSEDNDIENDDDIEISSYNDNSTQFNVGQLLNVTLDSEDNTVNVNLDENSLKEIFSGNFPLFISHLIFND